MGRHILFCGFSLEGDSWNKNKFGSERLYALVYCAISLFFVAENFGSLQLVKPTRTWLLSYLP